MESNNHQEQHPATSLSGVFEIPGEPAIVINGVPELNSTQETPPPHCDISVTQEPPSDPGFGRWLEGREVKKLFNGMVYSGIVTKFDKETGWYTVDYDDGDTEDFTWTELEPVLQPLDVTIPLKTLAQKILKRRQKAQKNGKVGRAKKIIVSSQLGSSKSPPN